MSHLSSLQKLEAYLKTESNADARRKAQGKSFSAGSSYFGHPAITISRQAGARGTTIGRKLVDSLQKANTSTDAPWTLFDKNLVEKVLQEHELPSLLAQFMPEDTVSEIESTVGEILGRHPSLWTLLEKTTQTILKLGRMGHVIVVGRGANIITANLPNVTHLRLVGSLERRQAHLRQIFDLSPQEAEAYIKREDGARKRYLKKHFGKNIDDPLLYDLVINTDRLSNSAVVRIITHYMGHKNRGGQKKLL